ncbi:ecdysone-induced protein 74EF-like isoform X2 [Penaeus chinensis]|uniref:ecdysone-induced protein 74EF-like isoform X2 n=1 Tax=Penaeus chinensis TaxID=139456 RepID=UPI001FB74BB9|nr:ecdysone-induced protein 74EF-like isoform X2 [Penaeus chinensis]
MHLGETVKYSAGFCGHFPDSWSSPPAASSCDDPEAAQFSLCASCIADMASLISTKCSIPTAVGKSIPFGLLSTRDFSSPDSPVCVQRDHSSHALSPRVLQKLSDPASGAASASCLGDPSVREKRERTADALGNAQTARPTRPLANGEPRTSRKDTGMVWEFLRRLLQDPEANPAIIRWESPLEGRFRLVEPEEVARRWGAVKRNSSMNYEKFGRAMRYQYKIKTLQRAKQKLVYKFGSNASGWQCSVRRTEMSTKEGVA